MSYSQLSTDINFNDEFYEDIKKPIKPLLFTKTSKTSPMNSPLNSFIADYLNMIYYLNAKNKFTNHHDPLKSQLKQPQPQQQQHYLNNILPMNSPIHLSHLVKRVLADYKKRKTILADYKKRSAYNYYDNYDHDGDNDDDADADHDNYDVLLK
ncbi:unnamed protein product [Schistosoma turkestanicum]|nr:unnamed protein product [Schistosoma turkestanicum]